MWNPDRYLMYADERARPFDDLMSRVPAVDASTVADLGCGPGTLTVRLAERWPTAHVVGVDSSAEMIDAAPSGSGVDFVTGDLRHWSPSAPVDILVSNATLQWVPGHLDLLSKLTGHVALGGWLAFQVPGNFGSPAHTCLRELADSQRWRSKVDVTWPSVHEPATYLDTLLDLGLRADVWETTYLQMLGGDDAVLDWMLGTALRPVLAALDPDDTDEFVGEFRAALSADYPRGPHGTLLPYRRLFAVAHKEPA